VPGAAGAVLVLYRLVSVLLVAALTWRRRLLPKGWAEEEEDRSNDAPRPPDLSRGNAGALLPPTRPLAARRAAVLASLRDLDRGKPARAAAAARLAGTAAAAVDAGTSPVAAVAATAASRRSPKDLLLESYSIEGPLEEGRVTPWVALVALVSLLGDRVTTLVVGPYRPDE
jgi:hypothetical protein